MAGVVTPSPVCESSAGDEASGVGDWSEGGQGDAMYDLATLTLVHEEHLDDVMAGYRVHIEIDVIRPTGRCEV